MRGALLSISYNFFLFSLQAVLMISFNLKEVKSKLCVYMRVCVHASGLHIAN